MYVLKRITFVKRFRLLLFLNLSLIFVELKMRRVMALFSSAKCKWLSVRASHEIGACSQHPFSTAVVLLLSVALNHPQGTQRSSCSASNASAQETTRSPPPRSRPRVTTSTFNSAAVPRRSAGPCTSSTCPLDSASLPSSSYGTSRLPPPAASKAT